MDKNSLTKFLDQKTVGEIKDLLDDALVTAATAGIHGPADIASKGQKVTPVLMAAQVLAIMRLTAAVERVEETLAEIMKT